MKVLIGIVAAAVLASIAGLVYVGSRMAEATVVPDPYEAGLRFDHDRHAHDAAAVGPRMAPECRLSQGPCARAVGSVMVTLEVAPRPVVAMRDLVFTVRAAPAAGAGPGAGRLALGMPGMYMGENRVALAPAGDGRWEGRGVIVRCPSGRRTWTADVELPASAQGQPPLTASFRFEVAE